MDVAVMMERQKYISVETYRRDGTPVRTPVWFYVKDGQIVVVTRSETGKAKRLRANRRVRIAPCTIRGRVKGPWASGGAVILDGEQTAAAVKTRDKKYGMMARLARSLTGGKGELFAFAIKLDDAHDAAEPA